MGLAKNVRNHELEHAPRKSCVVGMSHKTLAITRRQITSHNFMWCAALPGCSTALSQGSDGRWKTVSTQDFHRAIRTLLSQLLPATSLAPPRVPWGA